MTRHPSRRQPIINSTGTRRLAAQIRAMRRRQPTLDDTVDAIRDGDERVLHALVVRAQRGDSDAAVTAIWALLPRLAAVVINRLPIQEWHQGIDEYLTFAYLTIVDVDTRQAAVPPQRQDHLPHPTPLRTSRGDRARSCSGSRACSQPSDLPTTMSKNASSPIISLDEMIRAVQGGLIEKRAWDTLLRIRFGGEPGTASPRERKAASRAQRRLVEWSAKAA